MVYCLRCYSKYLGIQSKQILHKSPLFDRFFFTGIGEDMAVLDSTYYLSQIILSVFMGKLVEATGLPHFYIVISSLCGFLSAIMATRVAFTPSDFNLAFKS